MSLLGIHSASYIDTQTVTHGLTCDNTRTDGTGYGELDNDSK